jgi:hypothetical protein
MRFKMAACHVAISGRVTSEETRLDSLAEILVPPGRETEVRTGRIEMKGITGPVLTGNAQFSYTFGDKRLQFRESNDFNLAYVFEEDGSGNYTCHYFYR